MDAATRQVLYRRASDAALAGSGKKRTRARDEAEAAAARLPAAAVAEEQARISAATSERASRNVADGAAGVGPLPSTDPASTVVVDFSVAFPPTAWPAAGGGAPLTPAEASALHAGMVAAVTTFSFNPFSRSTSVAQLVAEALREGGVPSFAAATAAAVQPSAGVAPAPLSFSSPAAAAHTLAPYALIVLTSAGATLAALAALAGGTAAVLWWRGSSLGAVKDALAASAAASAAANAFADDVNALTGDDFERGGGDGSAAVRADLARHAAAATRRRYGAGGSGSVGGSGGSHESRGWGSFDAVSLSSSMEATAAPPAGSPEGRHAHVVRGHGR